MITKERVAKNLTKEKKNLKEGISNLFWTKGNEFKNVK